MKAFLPKWTNIVADTVESFDTQTKKTTTENTKGDSQKEKCMLEKIIKIDEWIWTSFFFFLLLLFNWIYIFISYRPFLLNKVHITTQIASRTMLYSTIVSKGNRQQPFLNFISSLFCFVLFFSLNGLIQW